MRTTFITEDEISAGLAEGFVPATKEALVLSDDQVFTMFPDTDKAWVLSLKYYCLNRNGKGSDVKCPLFIFQPMVTLPGVSTFRKYSRDAEELATTLVEMVQEDNTDDDSADEFFESYRNALDYVVVEAARRGLELENGFRTHHIMRETFIYVTNALLDNFFRFAVEVYLDRGDLSVYIIDQCFCDCDFGVVDGRDAPGICNCGAVSFRWLFDTYTFIERDDVKFRFTASDSSRTLLFKTNFRRATNSDLRPNNKMLHEFVYLFGSYLDYSE